MLPHAGGPYVYLREAFGTLTGFLFGWTEFLVIRSGSVLRALSSPATLPMGTSSRERSNVNASSSVIRWSARAFSST